MFMAAVGRGGRVCERRPGKREGKRKEEVSGERGTDVQVDSLVAAQNSLCKHFLAQQFQQPPATHAISFRTLRIFAPKRLRL